MKKKILQVKICTLQDTKFIRDLYNINVKKKLFNSKKLVTKKSHERWIKNILNSKKSKIYLGHINKQFGYVRIENLFENIYCVSIAIDKNYEGRGYATDLLNISIKKFSEKTKNFILFAFVKKNNFKSQKFFLKNDFSKIEINLKKSRKLKKFINKNNYIFVYLRNIVLDKIHS